MSDSNYVDTFLKAWKKLDVHLEHVLSDFQKKESIHSRKSIERIMKLLVEARSTQKEIILLGVGRDADILDMFYTRLRQIGFDRGQVKVVKEEGSFDYVVGGPNSIAICLSGRGFTSPTAEMARVYKERGAKLIVITSNEECPLTKSADVYLIIEGLTPFDLQLGRYAYGAEQKLRFSPEKLHPGPTLFEVASIIVLESIISALYFSFHGKKRST